MTRLMEASGFEVASAGNLLKGLPLLDGEFDIVVLDLMLPDGSGARLLQAVRDRGLRCRIVVTTGMSDRQVESDLHGLNPDLVLTKPISFDTLLAFLEDRRGPRA